MLHLKLLSFFVIFLIVGCIKSKDNKDLYETTVKYSRDYTDGLDKSILKGIFEGAKKFVSTVESVDEKILDVVKHKIERHNDDIRGADDSIDTISEKTSGKIIDGAKKATKIIEKTSKVVIEKARSTSTQEL